MKKSVLHIKLPYMPPFGNGNGQNNLDSGGFDDWAKGILIVNGVMLFTSF
jgi:hypothetical protein